MCPEEDSWRARKNESGLGRPLSHRAGNPGDRSVAGETLPSPGRSYFQDIFIFYPLFVCIFYYFVYREDNAAFFEMSSMF